MYMIEWLYVLIWIGNKIFILREKSYKEESKFLK